MLHFLASPVDLFDNYMQQDAHEFLNYLLNTVADILQEEKKQEKQNGRLKNNGTAIATDTEPEQNKAEPTWVHDIFQGTLTNETRCLNCETVCVLCYLKCFLRTQMQMLLNCSSAKKKVYITPAESARCLIIGAILQMFLCIPQDKINILPYLLMQNITKGCKQYKEPLFLLICLKLSYCFVL